MFASSRWILSLLLIISNFSTLAKYRLSSNVKPWVGLSLYSTYFTVLIKLLFSAIFLNFSKKAPPGLYQLSSFGGKLDKGFAYGKKSKNNVATFLNKILLIKSYSERLRQTFIFNKDYSTLIDRFDSEDTFFYFDPPYKDTSKYVVQKENEFDYDKFVTDLKNIKGKWMLSHYKDDYIEENFKDYNIVVLKHYRSISKAKDGERPNKDVNECIVMNYDINDCDKYIDHDKNGNNYINELW